MVLIAKSFYDAPQDFLPVASFSHVVNDSYLFYLLFIERLF